MTAPSPATTLMRAVYDLQRAALQPAYDRATFELESAYRRASQQWAGAMEAMRLMADEASRSDLRTSPEYALFRADLHAGLRSFTDAARAIGEQMESDGIRKGEQSAYRTVALTDQPSRVDVSDVERITVKPQYPLRWAQMIMGWEQRLDEIFAAAELGYSATWIVDRIAAYFAQKPMVDALSLVRTIQTIMAQRTMALVYRRMQ